MRIILATETFVPHVDGIVTRLTQTVDQLQAAGDDVLIIMPQRPGAPQDYHGARVLTLPSRAWPQYPDIYLATPWLTPAVARVVREFRPEVIHAACPAFLGTGIVRYARAKHIPLVASYHVQYAEYVRRYKMRVMVGFVWWYEKMLHNQAQLSLATSLPMVRELRGHGFKHMKLWSPGVDAVRFTPSKASQAWRERLSDGHPEEFLLICAARLAREKSIDAIAPILRAVPGVRLALAGDGPARSQLEQVFAGLPVHFADMLHGEDLAAAYASADAFILPSLTETLGLVALEAMAAGLPALVSRAGGLPDLVLDGQTGYLISPEHPEQFAERVRELRDHAELRQQLATRAREHAASFGWKETTAQLRAYYRHVIERYPLPAAEDFVAPLPDQALAQASTPMGIEAPSTAPQLQGS